MDMAAKACGMLLATSTRRGGRPAPRGTLRLTTANPPPPPRPRPAQRGRASPPVLLRHRSCVSGRRFASTSTAPAAATASAPRHDEYGVVDPATTAVSSSSRSDAVSLATTQPPARAGEPWKTLLEMPARAKWRVSRPSLPLAIEEARNDVLRLLPRHFNLKAKVLQKVLHETVFESHRALARQRDKERRQAYYGFEDENNDKKKKKSGKAGGASSSSSSTTNSSSPQLLSYGPAETVASLRHRLHPHYEVIRRVLLEAKSLTMTHRHRRPIRRVIDFGSGVGSASLAALDVFGAGRGLDRNENESDDGIEWVHGVDASRTMQEVAGELLERYCHHRSQEEERKQQQHDDVDDEEDDAHRSSTSAGAAAGAAHAVPPRFTFSSHLSSSSSSSNSASSSSAAAAAAAPVAAASGFDLALCCYSVTELPTCAAGLAAAAMLWDKLAMGGVLVVVEPGTPDGFANVRTIRSMLLDCCRPDENANDDVDDEGAAAEECHILAPCTHRGKCPMELYPQKQQRKDKTSRGGGGTNHLEEATPKDEPSDDDSDDDDGHDNEDDADADGDANDQDDETDDESSDVAAGEATRRGYCSFVQAMPGVAAFASSRSKGEKFSYLVVQKRVKDAGKDRPSDSNVPTLSTHSLTELLQRTHQSTFVSFEDHSKAIQDAIDLEDRYLDSDLDPLGLEFLQSDENRASFGRILHAPIKRKGHVWIDCCTGGSAVGGTGNDYADGRIVRHGVSKSMSKVAAGMYAAARKSRWGGYWPSLSPPAVDRHPSDDNDHLL